MAEIVLDRVTKRYTDDVPAVDQFDLRIADGELVVLVGPSGCGKSTVLNMVAGLEDITSGALLIDGKVMNGVGPQQRDLSMVFQSYALYPHLSVRENLAFPLKLAKTDGAAIERRVGEVAELLKLRPLLDRRPSNLSGGQRQRVAMGRAIVRTPRAFLMDEPLSNLDAKLRTEMRREVAGIQKKLGITTLYVTHDQTEAMTLGDRVVVMRQGTIQQVAPPQVLYDRPANLFVATFIGSPPMNLVPAAIAAGQVRSPLGEMPIPRGMTETGERALGLILGIRPEDVRIVGSAAEPSARFTAPVAAVESIGSDLFVYLTLPGEPHTTSAPALEAIGGSLTVDEGLTIVARVPPDARIQVGDTVTMGFAPDRTHLFEAVTGDRLA